VAIAAALVPLMALCCSCDERDGAFPPVTPAPGATTALGPPAPATSPPSTAPPASGNYVFPVRSPNVGYAHTHAGYPATDIIARCGVPVVAPTDGTVTEVRRVDRWDPRHDNPALRGGESVTMIGTDGVRYYGSHLQNIRDDLTPGTAVLAGEALAEVGQTGDARLSTCHLHLGISPPCPGTEWEVRRGVVYPWPYLDAWREGKSLSPAFAVAAWTTTHPNACAEAMALPTAADSG